MTVGHVAKALASSIAVGLTHLADMILADSKSSKYYINGLSRLSPEIRRYLVTATIASHPCDALMAEILEDDRVLRRLDHLKATFREETEWIASIGKFTWSRLASLAGRTPQGVRHDCMRAATIAGGYIDRKIFATVSRPPFALAIGDIAANLDTLALSVQVPQDDVSMKLHTLMRLGHNRRELIATVRLVKDISFTTVGAEQGHGSLAVIHKHHKDYSNEMLSQRALIHTVRALFHVSLDYLRIQRLKKRLSSLRRRVPERVTGRHIYLGELMATAKTQRR